MKKDSQQPKKVTISSDMKFGIGFVITLVIGGGLLALYWWLNY